MSGLVEEERRGEVIAVGPGARGVYHPAPMPPPRGHSPAFIDRARVDAVLAPLVPDAADRAFVLRCVLDEGPGHHRGANYVLLAMLGELVDVLGAQEPVSAHENVAPVAMRVPPHLARDAPKHYPLGLPIAPLLTLAEGDARAAKDMAAALNDGPPQHALANAAMVALLHRALEAARKASGG